MTIVPQSFPAVSARHRHRPSPRVAVLGIAVLAATALAPFAVANPAYAALQSPAQIENVYYTSAFGARACLSATEDQAITTNGAKYAGVVIALCGATFNAGAQHWQYDPVTKRVQNVFYT